MNLSLELFQFLANKVFRCCDGVVLKTYRLSGRFRRRRLNRWISLGIASHHPEYDECEHKVCQWKNASEEETLAGFFPKSDGRYECIEANEQC